MKFRIEREKIIDVIDHVEGIIEKRNTIPILSNILLQAKGDKLKITGTDLDIVVTDQTGDVTISQEGETTVGVATFSALIRKMPSNSLIDMEIDNNRLLIRSGRIRYQIPVLPADDFVTAKATEGETFTISVDALAKAFKLVKDSMSTEETRYYLNGAFLAIEDEKLVAVSTDGHRLSIAEVEGVKIDQPNAIVPRKAVGELIKILNDYEGEIRITIDARSIRFSIGDLIFQSKLIDGTFPDYTRVVPLAGRFEFSVDPKVLQQAIERVTVVSMERTSAVKFDVKDGKIVIAANSPDAGYAEEEVAAETNGEITLGYNGRYLKDILSSYQDAEVVIFTVENETSPTLLKPKGSQINRSVLMPMRI